MGASNQIRSSRLGLLLCACLLVAGCGKKRKLGEVPAATGDSTRTLATTTAPARDIRVNNVQTPGQFILLRGTGRYEAKDQATSVTYRIHIEQGRRIWISAGVMGFEGVRILATPEQFSAVDRLNKRYIQGGYAALGTRIGTNVDYRLLEDILLGNATLQNPLYQPYGAADPAGQPPASFSLTDGRYLLRYFIAPDLLKLDRLQAFDAAGQQVTEAVYSNFQPAGAAALPVARQLDVAVPPRAARVQLQHREVVLGAEGLTFAFSIPDGYEAIQ